MAQSLSSRSQFVPSILSNSRLLPRLLMFSVVLLGVCSLATTVSAQQSDPAAQAAQQADEQTEAASQSEKPDDPDFDPFEHAFGPWSLLPPVLAIFLAIITRRIVPSLLLGILCGAVALQVPAFNQAEPGGAKYWDLTRNSLSAFGEDFLWAPLTDGDLLSVFAFTMLMGAMVGVAHASGGMYGLVDKMSPLARTRRGGQMTGWGLGMVVFFDDYANTLLLGNTLRPVMDRLKISREKLAYIVDSTSAPIASIALISTWVATELQYIGDGYEQLGLNISETTADLRSQAFIQSIPYRFYAIMALVFVAIIAWMGRDFGPMLKAERRAAKRRSGEDGDEPLLSADDPFREEEAEAEEINADEAAINPSPETPRRWFNAVLPIVVTVGVTLWLIIASGTEAIGAGEPLLDRFQQGDSYYALRYGALAGLLVAAFSAWSQRLLNWKRIGQAAFVGAKMVLPALVILWLASGIKNVTGSVIYAETSTLISQENQLVKLTDEQKDAEEFADVPKIEVGIEQTFVGNATINITTENAGETITRTLKVSSHQELTPQQAAVFDAAYDRDELEQPEFRSGGLGTADYVGSVIRDLLSPFWMPTIVFILAAAVAFATGTSWGTMGILTPLVVSVTYRMLEAAAGANPDPAALVHDPILLASIGSVLAGAIFGDHCSPISDTTVLSSVASGCNHIAHVRTQMPYAIVVALLVIPLGTIPAGLGLDWYGAVGCMVLATVAAVGLVYFIGKPLEEPTASTATSGEANKATDKNTAAADEAPNE